MAEPTFDNKKEKPKQGFWHIVVSTCAAAFGVQTHKNHERDFTEGSIKTYIVAGIIFTAVFVAVIYLGVQLVLRNVGLS